MYELKDRQVEVTVVEVIAGGNQVGQVKLMEDPEYLTNKYHAVLQIPNADEVGYMTGLVQGLGPTPSEAIKEAIASTRGYVEAYLRGIDALEAMLTEEQA